MPSVSPHPRSKPAFGRAILHQVFPPQCKQQHCDQRVCGIIARIVTRHQILAHERRSSKFQHVPRGLFGRGFPPSMVSVLNARVQGKTRESHVAREHSTLACSARTELVRIEDLEALPDERFQLELESTILSQLGEINSD